MYQWYSWLILFSQIVYKRYASLFFCCAVDDSDNELLTLEIIHRYVEILDKYFGSVCELDIIFNFEKAYYILDEFILAGSSDPDRLGRGALNGIDSVCEFQGRYKSLLRKKCCKRWSLPTPCRRNIRKPKLPGVFSKTLDLHEIFTMLSIAPCGAANFVHILAAQNVETLYLSQYSCSSLTLFWIYTSIRRAAQRVLKLVERAGLWAKYGAGISVNHLLLSYTWRAPASQMHNLDQMKIMELLMVCFTCSKQNPARYSIYLQSFVDSISKLMTPWEMRR